VGDVGDLIVSSVIKMLDMRKRREEVAAFLRGMLIPLHMVLCSLMAMIASIISAFLEFVSAVGQYSPTLGMFMAVPPVPIGLYFYMAISALTIVSSVAAAVVEGDTKLTLTLYLGILALGGAAYHVTYALFESLIRSIWVPQLPLQPMGLGCPCLCLALPLSCPMGC